MLVLSLSVLANATITWDIVDENYGSGTGEASFNANYDFPWGGSASETLTAGKATLALPQGSGFTYSVKASDPPPWAGGPVTIEFKTALRDGASMNVYFSEQSSLESVWNHLLQLDCLYASGYHADVIQDYNIRVDGNVAPVGFDSSVPHIYRIVNNGGSSSTSTVYLDNNPMPLTVLANGAGANGDRQRLIWGFGQNINSASEIDMYYFKVASGAYAPVPEPATMILLGLGAAGLCFRKK
jgi:hypothetical protein